jgi:hypothetical protein
MKNWKNNPKRPNRTYCSDICRNQHQRAITKCSYCNKKIRIAKSELKEHNFCNRKCLDAWQQKENSPAWKGGFSFLANTGHKVIITDSFYKNKPRKCSIYRPEHRVVVEKLIGRKLKKNNEPIWHLNGLPTDNRPENLYVFPNRSAIMKAIQGTIPMPSYSNLKELKEAK